MKKSSDELFKLASGGSELISAPGRRFLLSLREKALLLRRHKYITNWEPRARAPRPLIANCNKRVQLRSAFTWTNARWLFEIKSRCRVKSLSRSRKMKETKWCLRASLRARQRETSGSATIFSMASPAVGLNLRLENCVQMHSAQLIYCRFYLFFKANWTCGGCISRSSSRYEPDRMWFMEGI